MKKVFFAFAMLAGLLVFTSCGSTAVVLNHGFYSDGEPLTEVATVTVDKNLEITGIDKSSSVFAIGVEGWSRKVKDSQLQEFTINQGVHTISVKFRSGSRYAIFSKVLIAQFEADKNYLITYEINGKSVIYDIINMESSESAVLDVDALQGKAKNPISQFINAVLNPTMEGTDKTVIEVNDDYVLTSLPQMRYELKNKKNGSVQKGFRGFETDFTFKKGTVYLYETNTVSSKEEFLKTDYQKTSAIVLEVVDCDQKTVTYKYVKPEEMAGKTVTFTISVE